MSDNEGVQVLIVEDDAVIATGLEFALAQEQFQVTIACSVKEAYECIEKSKFSLYLLDLSLPDGTGYDICKKVKKDTNAAVIFLTAVEDEGNVVMGLDMGADDYITKPFRLRELISRIRSVLRRYGKQLDRDDVVLIQDIKIHINEAKVYKGDEEILLTAMEYRLLLVFIQHQKHVLSRNQLIEALWDVNGDFVNDNTLTVYIKRLREKLEDDPASPRMIKTIRGLGYMMDNEGV